MKETLEKRIENLTAVAVAISMELEVIKKDLAKSKVEIPEGYTPVPKPGQSMTIPSKYIWFSYLTEDGKFHEYDIVPIQHGGSNVIAYKALKETKHVVVDGKSFTAVKANKKPGITDWAIRPALLNCLTWSSSRDRDAAERLLAEIFA